MSKLTNKIRMAQVEAGEQAVVESLRAKGLLTKDEAESLERSESDHNVKVVSRWIEDIETTQRNSEQKG